MGGIGFDERRFRGFVADHLGIDSGLLVPNVSLRDELAVDSLDLADLALALEARFGIAWPDRALDRVRNYGDLLRETCARITATATPRVPALAAAATVDPGALPIGAEGRER